MTGSPISLDYDGWTPPRAMAPATADWLRLLPPGRRTTPLQPAAGVWWALLHRRDGWAAERSLVGVASDRFPDATPVDLTALGAHGRRPAGWLVELRFSARDGRPLGAEVAGWAAAPGLPLWFAEVHGGSGDVPTAGLLAFAGTAAPRGALPGPHEIAARGVRADDRVGELRWGVRSGVVERVAVSAPFRRRGVGSTLVTVAEALRVLRGWAPLRSDGRLTDDGAAWLAGGPAWWRGRLAARTTVLPPEPGADEATGVSRLLR